MVAVGLMLALCGGAATLIAGALSGDWPAAGLGAAAAGIGLLLYAIASAQEADPPRPRP